MLFYFIDNVQQRRRIPVTKDKLIIFLVEIVFFTHGPPAMVSRILLLTTTKGMCTHKGSDLNKYRWNWLLQKDRFGSKSSDLSLGKFVVIFEVFEHHSSIHGCIRKFMNIGSKGSRIKREGCVAIFSAPSKSHQVLRHFIFPVKSLILVVQFNGQFCSSNGCKLPKVCSWANLVPL